VWNWRAAAAHRDGAADNHPISGGYAMRRVVTVLTAAVAAVTFSTMVFAQAPAAKPAPKAGAAKAEKLTVRGEGKYDEATKTLTVGDKTFTLAPDAKITMGAKAATTGDITGKHVMVTYTVVDGKNVASKVTIASAQPKAEKEKKTEKK
jgi:hypothetical protein